MWWTVFIATLCLCADERKSEAAEGNRSSMLCGVVLGVLILVFAVCAVFLIIFMFIFLSSYLLPSKSVVTY